MTQQDKATQDFFNYEESLEKQKQSALDEFNDAIKNRDKATIQPLLDDFAKTAMQSLLVDTGNSVFGEDFRDSVSKCAYDIASAMMQERERRIKG